MRVLVSLLACFLFLQQAYPQARDTAFLADAVRNSVAQYTKSMHGQANLYNGSEYREPRRTNDQHPYFVSEDWLEGSVLYDGDWYEHVPLQYDITRDVVITEMYTSGNPMALVDAKVGGFSIDGHMFRKLIRDTLNALPETGFYDILYDGKTRVIARRQKSTQERIENLTVAISFEERNRYFILQNGYYHAVKSKRSVLNVLKSRQSDLKKYLRASGVKFGNDRETALRKMAEFYDTPEHQ
jgi:hypothetical protein